MNARRCVGSRFHENINQSLRAQERTRQIDLNGARNNNGIKPQQGKSFHFNNLRLREF